MVPIPLSQMVPRSDGQRAHNYRTISKDSTVTFYEGDEDEENVAPLTRNEYGLLAGVKSPWARYKTFLEGKLDWGTKLKKGDQVSVELPGLGAAPSGATPRASAVIRFVGEVKTLPGITFGVEIKVAHTHLFTMSIASLYHCCYFRIRTTWGGGVQTAHSKKNNTSAAEIIVECSSHLTSCQGILQHQVFLSLLPVVNATLLSHIHNLPHQLWVQVQILNTGLNIYTRKVIRWFSLPRRKSLSMVW